MIKIKVKDPNLRSTEWLEKLEEDLRELLSRYSALASFEVLDELTGNELQV